MEATVLYRGQVGGPEHPRYYVWTKDGEVVIQVVGGNDPSSSTLVSLKMSLVDLTQCRRLEARRVH